jgi:RNA polymerase sigma-70 factor, ECF subfamily
MDSQDSNDSKSTSLSSGGSDAAPADAWIDNTYSELVKLASSYLAGERQTVTLSPTVLVHEVYMRLSKQTAVDFQSKSHFFAVASTMMRRILVDHARSRSRTKRGGKHQRVIMDESMLMSRTKDADVLEMDEALDELSGLDPRQARIVEMRFFGGMTVPEVAEVLQLSTRTVEKEWQVSKAWLRRRLDESSS